MKTENRVAKAYKKGTKDWGAQYDMLLPDNATCNNCISSDRCDRLFGQNLESKKCQFHPNRFFESEINPITK